MSSVAVVVTVYNAEPGLENLYDQLMTAIEPAASQSEVIMVEDHGTDDSRSIVTRLVKQEPEGSVWPTGNTVNPTDFRMPSKSIH